jgi:hypothetical protein
MDKLCKNISEFDLDDVDGSELCLAFSTKLYEAVMGNNNSPLKRRVVRKVEYERPDTSSSHMAPTGNIV